MALHHHFVGSDSFVSRLIRHKAQMLVRHPGFGESELPDVEQELFLEIVCKWDCYEARRASERTFIVRIVRNKAISLVRARLAGKRDPRRESQSLNEPVCDEDGGSVERAQTFDAASLANHTGQSKRSDEEQAGLRQDVADVLEQLPEEDQLLAELLIDMSEYAASRILDQSRRQIAKGKSRLRRRFEDAGLRDYL